MMSTAVHGRRFIFFFSSRRRHTRCSRDWSSDVCSSDLFGLRRATGVVHPAIRVQRGTPMVFEKAPVERVAPAASHEINLEIRLSKPRVGVERSEEHTSELQSRLHLVCRLLLEKKKAHRCYSVLTVRDFA